MDGWDLPTILLKLLVPILSNFALQSVLFVIEASVLGRISVHTLEHLHDIFELLRDRLFLLLDVGHHLFEYPFALNFRFIFKLLVALITTTQLCAVFLLSLLTDLVLSFFTTLFKGDDSPALKIGDGAVVEVVQSGASDDQLAAQAGDQAHARVVQQVN